MNRTDERNLVVFFQEFEQWIISFAKFFSSHGDSSKMESTYRAGFRDRGNVALANEYWPKLKAKYGVTINGNKLEQIHLQVLINLIIQPRPLLIQLLKQVRIW